jgi:hypothetical protein
MASLEVVALVLTGLSIAASIIYYANVLSNANKTQKLQLETRRTQIFMQLHQSKYDQEGLEAIFKLMNLEWENFEDYMEKHSGIGGHYEIAAALESWISYFDGLGILVKDNVIDLDMVYNIAFSRILFVWFKFETIIKGFRNPPLGWPDYGQHLEYLANEMIKIRRQQNLPMAYSNLIHPTSELFEEYNQ